MGQAGSSTVPDERQANRKRRPSLTDTVCEHIRIAILSGARWPGLQLPTATGFVDAPGVSRTVIREALARFAAEDLVEARQRKGLFVSETARYQAFQITRDEMRPQQRDPAARARLGIAARVAARTHMSGSLKRHRELHDLMAANSSIG